MDTRVRFTVADLDFFPDDGNRYEVIDGELFVSKAPHYLHQLVLAVVASELALWDPRRERGYFLPGPGIVFAYDSGVVPDLVWISRARLAHVLGDDGKLRAAPDLVVEVLSPGSANERRDLDVKLRLYSRQGVLEYWVFDRERQTILVYRRVDAALELATTLSAEDRLTSPLLSGFDVAVDALFAPPSP